MNTLNDEGERSEVWNELIQVILRLGVMWVLWGDFNYVRGEEERIGRGDIWRATTKFNEFINEAGLIDLLLMGRKFTWCNNRKDPTFSRLDRFLD